MLKLYRLNAAAKEYWETWDDGGGTHTVHWGILGTRGQTKLVKSTIFKRAEAAIQSELDHVVRQGFQPIAPENHDILIIEFPVERFGTSEDLEKRHRLEDRMDETLGWTGLGACDGGSSGSGTMEVCNFVVDFEIAKRVVENDLLDTEFSNFSRIYNERIES